MDSSEIIEDIKQLLTAELAASEDRMAKLAAGLATKEDLMQLRNDFRADLEEAQEAIADVVTTGLEAVDSTKQVDDHEHRITRLEHHAA
jgi:hypothetical protein